MVHEELFSFNSALLKFYRHGKSFDSCAGRRLVIYLCILVIESLTSALKCVLSLQEFMCDDDVDLYL